MCCLFVYHVTVREQITYLESAWAQAHTASIYQKFYLHLCYKQTLMIEAI